FGTLRTTTNTYTFTDQPLVSTMTESGGVKMVTENAYDTYSGLLLYTDVTINGTNQRVSKVTYDDLGRITSVVRGNETNSGGTVSYGYNLHGQTTSITGPGFSQRLHYTDGPGKPLYNGSVSAMSWTMGTDATRRGYKYTYNGYNWLTLAEYGEGDNLTDHKNRYTENSLEFMLNGGIRRLQRHGLKADGVYGKIDNLHIYYDGNRITGVLEDADVVTQPGSMDYPGKQKEMAFAYNEWGALIKDESRGITYIDYDYTGNPTCVYFSDGSYSYNVYSLSGVKLRTHHYTKPKTSILTPVGQSDDAEAESQGLTLMDGNEYIEYHGPVIYRNGKIDMVQFPGGYATIDGGDVTFHYYTQDYLGNNRAVINGTTGAIEHTTAYYPYGAVIADLGTGNSGQPFKFIGKELISANGLNEYDFGARRQYPAIPQFTSIDKFADTYPHLSPYLYCANNPINAIDNDGNFWETVWDVGNLLYDVGAAIVDHAKGNHQSAAGHWIDAGADGLAVIIPFVPAGASKLGKAAVAIDKASDAKTASKGMKNVPEIKEGLDFQEQVSKELRAQGKNVSEQVTLVPKNGEGNVKGNRIRADALVKEKDGTTTVVEAKRSSTTRLSTGQEKAKRHIENGNKKFEVRSNKDGYKKNQEIRVDKWDRKNKYEN
ncbi:MAG: hypothetical protein NC095_09900, partial [Muribaculum sp.]|nr:hypothetical protein [Muribaculum sp.]